MKEWNLRLPNLLISVFGGTEEYTPTAKVKNVFITGLLSVAHSTGAWIIYEGINTGIMQYIGEAIRNFNTESSRAGEKSQIVTIGIAAWGIIENRDTLISKATMPPVEYTLDEENQGTLFCLDNNLSQFILVDDGTHGSRRVEIPLRLLLEEFISEQSLETGGGSIRIPLVRVLFNGEKSTLEIIFDAMNNSIPCVLVDGSGGITDIIVQVATVRATEITTSLIRSKLRTSLRRARYFPPLQVLEWTKTIQDIVRKSNLLTIFKQDESVEKQSDVEQLLVDAFIKASQSSDLRGDGNVGYQLKLAKLWKRIDIAKNGISQALEPEQLQEVMIKALLENNWQFVQLGMDYLDLNTFLTWNTLVLLYKSIDPLKPIYSLLNPLSTEERKHPQSEIHMHHIAKVLRGLLGELTEPLYPHLKYRKSSLEVKNKATSKMRDIELPFGAHVYAQYPVRDLLIWAVVQHYAELADVLWAKSEDCIAGALACRKILIELSHTVEDTEILAEMKDIAENFEQAAIGVFAKCSANNEKKSEELLTRVSMAWGEVTCLQLAMAAEATNFMSHGGVQVFLTKIWWGALSTINSTFSVVISALCIPLIYTDLVIFRTKGNSEELGEEQETMNWWQRLSAFSSAPVVIFYRNLVSHVCFLLLFAYILTMDFHVTPNWKEYFLYGWTFTLLCEEVRQCFHDVEDMGYVKKFNLYISDFQNKMDILNLLLFLVGVILRCIKSTIYPGKIVLALDFGLFCVRLMHMFAVNKYLGPKIIMMHRMVTDTVFFICLLAVSLISYGVSKQAILVNNEHRWTWILRNVIYEPYLILFGDYSDTIDGLYYNEDTCTLDGSNPAMTKCPYNDGAGHAIFPDWLTIILHCIYLLFANILLINLLIAMFSSTFAEIQDHTDEIWKFQRYPLIADYYSRTVAPPPFIILTHIYTLFHCSTRVKTIEHKITLMRRLNKADDTSLLSWEDSMRKLYLQTHATGTVKSSDEETENVSKIVSFEVNQILAGQAVLLRTIEHRLELLENKTTDSLTWILRSLSQIRADSMENVGAAMAGSSIDVNEVGKPPIEETLENLKYLHHVNARESFYHTTPLKRFPVPDEKVPWQVRFPNYRPVMYTASEGKRKSLPGASERERAAKPKASERERAAKPKASERERAAKPKNPKGRTGVQGLGRLNNYGPNLYWYLLLTCWNKNKAGILIRRDSKKMMEILAVKNQSTKKWALPGGMLHPNESIPSALKAIVKSSSWDEFKALIQAESNEVYNGYIDDSRNTDDAWVEATAVHLHLKSQVISNMLVLNNLEGRAFTWMVINKNMPLYVLKREIFKNVALSLDAYF